jgi:lipopolysaccharide transport system ATP-binding protein
MATVLALKSVSKMFWFQHARPMTLKESVMRRLTGPRDPGTALWALRDVSFSVQQGQSLGIIGHNGAGKSTLLRLICGLGQPTNGYIRRGGHVSGLLDLGNGFHPDMTGRENIMTGGLLCGLTRRQVLEQQDAIIAFAELEQFIDQPVRTYSSGMYLRLAFATAMQFDPAVLVIDEILAVGDTRFQQKCLERLARFRAAGKTLLLTSHVADHIRALCDEVLVLEDGRVAMQGEPDSAITCYIDLMRQRTERRSAQLGASAVAPPPTTASGNRQGTQEAQLTAVEVCGARGEPLSYVPAGSGVTIKLSYRLAKPIPDMALILGIYSESNNKCFETAIPSLSAAFGPTTEEGSFTCRLPELPLLPGRYYINVGLYPIDWDYLYDYHWQMHELRIVNEVDQPNSDTGVISLHPVWSLSHD